MAKNKGQTKGRGKKPPPGTPVLPKVLQLKTRADQIKDQLTAMRSEINAYAEDAAGSPEHAIALAAAGKQCKKARDSIAGIVLALLAAHGAAESGGVTEQESLLPTESDSEDA